MTQSVTTRCSIPIDDGNRFVSFNLSDKKAVSISNIKEKQYLYNSWVSSKSIGTVLDILLLELLVNTIAPFVMVGTNKKLHSGARDVFSVPLVSPSTLVDLQEHLHSLFAREGRVWLRILRPQFELEDGAGSA